MDTILAKDKELHMKLPQSNMIKSHHKGPLLPPKKKKNQLLHNIYDSIEDKKRECFTKNDSVSLFMCLNFEVKLKTPIITNDQGLATLEPL